MFLAKSSFIYEFIADCNKYVSVDKFQTRFIYQVLNLTVELRNEERFINLKSSHFFRKVKKQLYIVLLFSKVFYPGKVMCNNY